MLTLAIAVGGSSAAVARVSQQAGEARAYWELTPKLNGKPQRVARSTQVVRILFGVDVCDSETNAEDLVKGIAVQRRPNTVIITVTRRVDDQPYGEICQGFAEQVIRKVRLKGRLGKRSIKDGFFTPPRKVVNRPPPRR